MMLDGKFDLGFILNKKKLKLEGPKGSRKA